MLFFLGQDRTYLAERPKPDGCVRILCVGDSMTFGQGCPPDATLPYQLEVVLNATLWTQRIEVVNGGVSGYSIHDAWARYLDTLGAYQPDIVVLVVCDNDAELFNHREATEEHVRRQSYVEFSESCYAPDGQHFPYFRALVADMAAHARAGGPRVMLAFYDIHGGSHRDLLVGRVCDACRDAALPFADLSQDFLDVESAMRNAELRVSSVDAHPSTIAHGIAARRLARSLIAEHLMPAPAVDPDGEPAWAAAFLADADHAIADRANAGTALSWVARTLAAKRDSRARLSVPRDEQFSEAAHVALLGSIDESWRRFANLAVWEAYVEGLRDHMAQFGFGMSLFEMALRRLEKCLYVIERRLDDASFPVVNQFEQWNPCAQGAPRGEDDSPSIDALSARLGCWADKLTRAREFAVVATRPIRDGAAMPRAEAHLRDRLATLAGVVRPHWDQAAAALEAARRQVARWKALQADERLADRGIATGLDMARSLARDAVGHLDFCLTAIHLDELTFFTRRQPQPPRSGLTWLDVTLTAPFSPPHSPLEEPLSLEVQVRPVAPFGRVVSDIHTIVRDGRARAYRFGLPFFTVGDLRLGVEGGSEVVLGPVHVGHTVDHIITLGPKDFEFDAARGVYRAARVLVPG